MKRGAFAFGVPKVSVAAMAPAGILGIAAGTTTPFEDMAI